MMLFGALNRHYSPSDLSASLSAASRLRRDGVTTVLLPRNAYGPPPTLSPVDMVHIAKENPTQCEVRVVPTRERLSPDMEDADDYSPYDADDSVSGTCESFSMDQDLSRLREAASDFGGSYGYSTEPSEPGEERRNVVRSSSRAESVYSFHSSVDNHLFRDFHGRGFNTLNPVYHLPADMEEHERLTIQHRIICLLLGNLYPAGDIVEDILREREGYTPMILDIGAGSGVWAIEMASKFPHCEVIGMDLVPPNLGNREIPDNCRFEIDDANLSLTHWANTFDLVHCRAIEVGIQDWEAFTYNVAQILRPGGLFLAGSGNTQVLNERAEPYHTVDEEKPGFTWIQKMLSAFHEAFVRQLGHDWPTPHWHAMAERNCNYKDVTSRQMMMPVGNWLPAGASTDLQYAAELTRYNFINLFKSFKPLLISRGYPEAMIDHWRTETVRELLELKVRSIAAWSWMWCRRTDAPWVPMQVRVPNPP